LGASPGSEDDALDRSEGPLFADRIDSVSPEATIGAGAGGAAADAIVVERADADGSTPTRRAIKRLIDLAGSMVLLVVLSPLLLALTAAVAIDSRGRPLFVQQRVGRSGRPFGLLKLRTMARDRQDAFVRDLERDPSLAQEWNTYRKLQSDPRVTRLGRFLRRYSLDELPQLINVALGQMSLIGPRPVLPEELPRFGDKAPAVLRVRPGITGLWAVSGRNGLSYEERVDLEYQYALDWSLALDLRILVRTVPCVLLRKGAY
jgi:lipopolysaccharide/colanic/teichoic acid biosynthesis glycosyltransferase